MPLLPQDRLSGWRFLLFNAALALANVVMLSNVPGYTVLAPYAAGGLEGVNPSFGTWATTDHMIGIALGLPFARWLAGRFGDYRVYCAALLAYAAAALWCAMSDTMWMFLPARIALGLAGGVALPLGQALTLNEYPENLRAFGVGFWGFLSMLPFTVGVFMGGWYAEYLSWRYLFISDIVVALIVAGVVGALLYGRGFRLRVTRFDGAGFVLLAAVLFGAQTIFNQGNDFDWFASPILMTALAVVVIALPAFIVWELGERHPVLDMRLFRQRNYAVATLCSVFGFLVIQGLLSLFAVQLQLLIGYTSSRAGLVYMMMIFLAAPVVAIVHLLNRNIDLRLVACLNFIGFAVTLTWLGLFDKLASFDQIAMPMTFFGFSLAIFFAPLGALAAHGLSGARLIRAAEELALLRTAAGAFGIALQGVVQFRRAPFHQLELADHFGGGRFASLDLLSQFSEKLQAMGLSAAMAQSQMARFLRQQASLLALNDAFLLGAFVFVLLAGFVWLAHPTPVASFQRKATLSRIKAEELMEQP
jgi:DHA2 family multidrug resistance protein